MHVLAPDGKLHHYPTLRDGAGARSFHTPHLQIKDNADERHNRRAAAVDSAYPHSATRFVVWCATPPDRTQGWLIAEPECTDAVDDSPPPAPDQSPPDDRDTSHRSVPPRQNIWLAPNHA